MHVAQPRREGHVGECSVAVVPQQRVGVLSLFLQPGAAENENVRVAVVVVVGVHHVQPAEEPRQPGPVGSIRKRTVPVVAEETGLAGRIVRRGHDVEVVVVVKVIDDRPATQVECLQPQFRADVDEPREVDLRLEGLRRDQELSGHAVGILSDGHRGDVEQPAGCQVHLDRILDLQMRAVQHVQELLDGLARSVLLGVQAAAPDRHDATL